MDIELYDMFVNGLSIIVLFDSIVWAWEEQKKKNQRVILGANCK